ncbi:hypothetical protein FEK33_12460 [Nocardia asteroides NBRC 15531]|uniref:Uncharacterized protein n=1 Tax=Nocardia asteroides NBRC 15531 TaxID=1110697 RepID=U5EJI4_NOCAS|nr:hypothetical protein [Nocardia asteroides]TLF66837.1 hypothetical protein FEK33_12460 [Nocardia asteroides NBRC 15531]GAD85284.1 hypothetical protein NCAST_30_00540 [Nocardia asteroides NBRC 15531]SFN02385.1 hypothetical protein SAMN05444423_105395 [Nocardia asteroides]VEG35167.1 Uncharacterised protein [Nocardia asteroides]
MTVVLLAVTIAATACLPADGSATSQQSPISVDPAVFTGKDPCEGRNGPGRMCRVVAVAPISGKDAVNPIAIALSATPSYELLVGLPDTVARYVSTLEGYYDSGDGLGPHGSFTEKQEMGLVAATDITGDGVPELIFWVGGSGRNSRFRVLRMLDGGMQVIDSPIGADMYSNADTWATWGSDSDNYGIFRCSPGKAVITRLAADKSSPGRLEGSEVDFHFVDNHTWRPGEARSNQPVPSIVPESQVAFDCPHTERRLPASASDKTAPDQEFTSESAVPDQPCTSLALPDGRATEIRAMTGPITCVRAAQVYADYRNRPPATEGNTNAIATPEWICSTPTAGTTTETGRVATCADGIDHKTWTFEVHLVS